MEYLIDFLVEILGYILAFLIIVFVFFAFSIAITIAGIILTVKGKKKQDKKMRNIGIVCLSIGIVLLLTSAGVVISFGTTA